MKAAVHGFFILVHFISVALNTLLYLPPHFVKYGYGLEDLKRIWLYI